MLTAEKLVRNFNRLRDRLMGPQPEAPSAEPRTARKRKPRPDVPGTLISEREFADRCDVSLRTVRRWRDHREDPAITKLGRKVFYSLEAIAAWQREREQKRGGRGRK